MGEQEKCWKMESRIIMGVIEKVKGEKLEMCRGNGKEKKGKIGKERGR